MIRLIRIKAAIAPMRRYGLEVGTYLVPSDTYNLVLNIVMIDQIILIGCLYYPNLDKKYHNLGAFQK
ncbi:MAG: hypothetical protein ACKPBB_13790 [Sphaerospermopsis kisseleviana]